MLSLIGVILIAANIFCARPKVDHRSEDQEIGSLPEVVVTGSRYETEDMAYCGMLPEIVITAPAGPEIGMLDEIVITAPRYEGEDIAYSGMLPEIVSTAKRSGFSRPVLAFMSLVKQKMPMRVSDLVIITRLNARNTGYLN